MDHDQNFKNLILDYPRDAIELFAATEATGIDSETKIIPIREEQLKERLGDRFRELDIPLLVEWPNGQRQAILFALEEETEPNRFSIHRLAHYCLDLSELYNTERVVPAVVFLRKGKYQTQLALGGDKYNYLEFRFLFCSLPELPYEKYRESRNIVALLNLPNMHYTPEERVDVYGYALRGLRQMETRWDKFIKYIDFIDIYANLDKKEQELYYQKYPEEGEIMSTFVERYKNEGKQEGLQIGKQEGLQIGKQEGEAQILKRQLTRKFGELSEEKRRMVETADSETLLKWSERVLTADSLEEVLF